MLRSNSIRRISLASLGEIFTLGRRMSGVKDLYSFLEEAELLQYYSAFTDTLKVSNLSQLKYVEDDDLAAIGLTKPEMRRFKKFYDKECPKGFTGKLRKSILRTHSKREVSHKNKMPTSPKADVTAKAGKYIIPAEAISIQKEIGTGEFGVVQQGIWTNEAGERVQVALKCLSKEQIQAGQSDFLKEASIMHSLDHESLVRLYGVVLDYDNSFMLVTELAPLRSLLECLKEPSLRPNFPVITLCEFALQVAKGMKYLEDNRLIHRDLAARNILVFSRDKVKISDFGLSRALGVGKDYYQTNFNVNLKLPLAWCAPESINYLKFTSASDVWGFGVTLWEMFCYGFQPWAALTGAQILEAVDAPNCQRLEKPDFCPEKYYELMRQCWEHEPAKRPKFCDIVDILPTMKPQQLRAATDHQASRPDFLCFQAGEIITVLEKGPEMWKGSLHNGKVGLFSPANTAPYDHNSPSKVKVYKRSFTRSGINDVTVAFDPLHSMLASIRAGTSKRGAVGKEGSLTITRDMISGPMGDFKHTMHIGLRGQQDAFGDTSFIKDKYHLLPVKSASYQAASQQNGHSSAMSTPDQSPEKAGPPKPPRLHLSEGDKFDGRTSPIGQSSSSPSKSQDSLDRALSGDVVNSDVSDHEYLDLEGDGGGEANGKDDFNLDLGPSLLDDVLKIMETGGEEEKAAPPPSPEKKDKKVPSSIPVPTSSARTYRRTASTESSSSVSSGPRSPTKSVSSLTSQTIEEGKVTKGTDNAQRSPKSPTDFVALKLCETISPDGKKAYDALVGGVSTDSIAEARERSRVAYQEETKVWEERIRGASDRSSQEDSNSSPSIGRLRSLDSPLLSRPVPEEPDETTSTESGDSLSNPVPLPPRVPIQTNWPKPRRRTRKSTASSTSSDKSYYNPGTGSTSSLQHASSLPEMPSPTTPRSPVYPSNNRSRTNSEVNSPFKGNDNVFLTTSPEGTITFKNYVPEGEKKEAAPEPAKKLPEDPFLRQKMFMADPFFAMGKPRSKRETADSRLKKSQQNSSSSSAISIDNTSYDELSDCSSNPPAAESANEAPPSRRYHRSPGNASSATDTSETDEGYMDMTGKPLSHHRNGNKDREKDIPRRRPLRWEIVEMQRVVGEQVSTEDCRMALREMRYDVDKAIKFIKLQQLVNMDEGDFKYAKQTLIYCNWDVDKAANFLLVHNQSRGKSTDL
ncbi:PREDICTED: ack-related non-receptor tyrosine kinase-like [Branchiostoma belcheri]|uniref:non-specific protein-tyrosine kinase n=1 Tax=Branchiostoma belcheri TaxID=7741 RepID=A0A6P4Y3N5_BRABE|nr:PREDICTED: ack-related non-receptor tyrosine kinase-like [Branchiostoma belcheri]